MKLLLLIPFMYLLFLLGLPWYIALIPLWVLLAILILIFGVYLPYMYWCDYYEGGQRFYKINWIEVSTNDRTAVIISNKKGKVIKVHVVIPAYVLAKCLTGAKENESIIMEVKNPEV